MKGNPTAVERIATSPAVQKAFGRARAAAYGARGAAKKPPRAAAGPRSLGAADVSEVRLTALLIDGEEARSARRRARQLGLPRTLDDTSAWAALGGLAALLRVIDDGRRRAVVIDTASARSVFSRWAVTAGFAPVHVDVMRPETVGRDIDARSVDFVARLHPHSSVVETVDADLARAAHALRRGGVVAMTVRLGPADLGAMAVADLRSLVARADEQGLALLGELDLDEGVRARKMQHADETGAIGLALLAFRRR